MAKCWTCGSEKPEFGFTCPVCTQTKEIVRVREAIESYKPTGIQPIVEFPDIDFMLDELSIDFSELVEGLSKIASVIEWGFEDLGWRVEQMTGVLKSIDKTLKHPGQTHANEWRHIAEELRNRGILDESEKFFLKSLEMNPLDYRAYIGLGKTYIKLERFEDAKNYFEKSFPHVPREEIDYYKSYSYRLVGRIYFCWGDYHRAALTLKTAVELSPDYYLGCYDYAQYLALIRDKENCLNYLRLAITKGLIPIKLVSMEKNFIYFEKEIKDLLRQIELDANIQEEMEYRKKWQQFRLKESCLSRLIDYQRRIENRLHEMTSDMFESSSSFVGASNALIYWSLLENRYKESLFSIIKEEMNLGEKTLSDRNKPLYEAINNLAKKLAEQISEKAKSEKAKAKNPSDEVSLWLYGISDKDD